MKWEKTITVQAGTSQGDRQLIILTRSRSYWTKAECSIAVIVDNFDSTSPLECLAGCPAIVNTGTTFIKYRGLLVLVWIFFVAYTWVQKILILPLLRLLTDKGHPTRVWFTEAPVRKKDIVHQLKIQLRISIVEIAIWPECCRDKARQNSTVQIFPRVHWETMLCRASISVGIL